MNALAHAWYGGSATVRVVLRRDGLEVTNTGSFLLDRDVAVAGAGCTRPGRAPRARRSRLPSERRQISRALSSYAPFPCARAIKSDVPSPGSNACPPLLALSAFPPRPDGTRKRPGPELEGDEIGKAMFGHVCRAGVATEEPAGMPGAGHLTS